MKMRTILVAAVVAATVVSCKNYKITNEQINEYQDSVFAMVPTRISVQARTEGESEGPKRLRVVMGVRSFYDASPEDKQAYAIKAGEMALRHFGDAVTQGSLILTKQIWNKTELPPDAIEIDMKLDSLREAMAPKK